MNYPFNIRNNSFKSFSKYFLVFASFVFLSSPYFAIAQEAMSSGDYAIQSDSVNFSGALSNSASYSLEDTLGEVATGNSSGFDFQMEAGYQAMLLLVLGDAVAPTAPPTISATPITSSSIEVTWGESTDNIAVTRYYIYRDGVRVDDVAVFPRSFVDSGLSSNTLYSYNVSAADDAGNESVWSATTTATTFTAPVSSQSGSPSPFIYNLSIVPTETSALVTFDSTSPVRATLSWGTNTSYSSGSISSNDLNSSHRFLIPNLSSATNYYLKIDLVRQDGFIFTFDNILFSTLQFPSSVLPTNASEFLAQARENDIELTWRLPSNPRLDSVRIVRSKDFYASSPSEGEIVYEGSEGQFIDSDVEKGVRYYYTLFTKDISGNFSSGVVSSAIILLPGQEPPPYLPEELDLSGEVHPMIDNLSLSDFLFIQDGESLEFSDNRVFIDGTKNLTIALKSYRVPPLLKTIAVTLATQEDNPRFFTFILRINNDKTRYEAVVAPLGDSASYGLKITVIDFKNQGLKKLEGVMLVATQAVWDPMAMYDRRLFVYSIGLIILLSVLVIFFKRRKKEVVEEKTT